MAATTDTPPIGLDAFESIHFSVADAVAQITLCRDAQLNAYTARMIQEIGAGLRLAEEDERVKVLILRGSREAFSAGADLREVLALLNSGDDLAFRDRWVVPVHELADRFESSRLVMIGVIEGFALAGGLELALACDLLLAAEDARIGDHHLSFDFIPGGGGTQRLARAIGAQEAKRLLFTGTWITGTEAAAIGLVLRAVPHDELDAAVEELVALVAEKGSSALRRTKQLVNTGVRHGLTVGLDLEKELVAAHMAQQEAQAGMRRFLDRRAPRAGE